MNELDLRSKKMAIDMKRAQEEQSLRSVVGHLRDKEDRKIRHNLEEDEIKLALKEIKQMKAGHLKDEKLKQLEEVEKRKKELDDEKVKIARELNQLDDDVLYSVQREQKRVQEKVDNSRYFKHQRRNQTELLRTSLEDQARLKHKQELLNQDMDRLNKGLNISGSVTRGRSSEPVKSSLLNVGNDIANASFDPYGASVKMSQAKIKKLMEERQRTLRQIDNDSTFDELEQLQFQVDNGYNTDINKYRAGIHDYTNQIRTERDLNPEEKARKLGNIRSKIAAFDPTSDSSVRINYHAAKPILTKKLNKLNEIIRSERNRETNEERRRLLENMNVKVPKFENQQNKSALDAIGNQKSNDYRQPLIMNYKKNTSRMSERQYTDREHKSFAENRMPDSKLFLPDIGHFKQNLDRTEDLEIEERAIMNMYAQDFDDLKLLNMLSGHEELYQHKLKQYKETSNSRIQAEKALQEQRLQKLRNYFGRENYEEEKKMELEKWMDEQEKNLISSRLRDRLNQPATPEYIPSPTPVQRAGTRPSKYEPDYDPEVGVGFHLDYAANIERGICNQVKAAYAVFNSGEMIIGNKHMGPVLTIPDDYSVTHEKAQFSSKHALKLIEPERNSNLIIELQIPDRSDPHKFKALGWTLINLFTFEQ